MARHTQTILAVGSLVVLAGLLAALGWRENQVRRGPGGGAEPPLIVLAAPTSRLPLERLAAEYEHDTGRRVELRFGPSEEILTKARLPNAGEPADLFLPADDSYLRKARELGLLAESYPIAEVRAVLLLAKGNPGRIGGWNDLLRDGVTVAVPNPGAAVGKLTREHLVGSSRWSAVQGHVIDCGSVTEAANAAKVGSVDAAVVWDAVAAAPGYRGQEVLALPELAGVTGRIELGVLTQSRDAEAARRFARFVVGRRGREAYSDAGFRLPPEAAP